MICHITYKNKGGINTYIQNLRTGSPSEHCITEVDRGSETTVMQRLMSKSEAEMKLVLHDPTFMRHITRPTSMSISMVLHGDNSFYYSAVEEFGQSLNGIICVSCAMPQQIPKRFHSKLLTLGPSVAAAATTTKPTKIHKEIQLIFVAREDENKGVQHLPIIDRALTQKGLLAKWTVVLGSRPQKINAFRNWTEDESSRVKISENIPNHRITELISEHDALVLPSKSEGHPMVLIEALSQSIPPFTFFYSTNCDNHFPPDLEGIVGPSIDADELAQRIIRHHQRSQKSLAKWQKSAQDYVKSNHNPSIQTEILQSYLASLPRTQKSPKKQFFYKWKRRALILMKLW